MTKSSFFHFVFFDENGSVDENLRFEIKADRSAVDQWLAGAEGSNAYVGFHEEIENYGTHDFFAMDDIALGYGSAEIAADKRAEVMAKWKGFLERNGYRTGDVVPGETPPGFLGEETNPGP